MPDWKTHALGAVEESGHRSGGARDAVIELLAGENCCLSAQQISRQLDRQDREVGLASIYRALDLLQGLGLVQRLDTGDGPSRFERISPGGDHHHHAVCESCGTLTPFEDDSLEHAIERLGARLEHRISGHDVVIRGLCPDCAPSR
ncbi:MAG: Fur family transcriptional regulator [Solirubrobacterales bacterium]